MAIKIGVYGSSGGNTSAEAKAAAIGAAIAAAGGTVVTGGCNGVPQAAVLAASEAGGPCIGFSNRTNEVEHIERGNPVEGFTEFRYIPEDYEHKDNVLVCMKYRNVSSVAFVDAAIIINGRIGTLNEFTNAFDMGKVIGVLKGSGGNADNIVPALVANNTKLNDAIVIFESDPELLIKKVIAAYGE